MPFLPFSQFSEIWPARVFQSTLKLAIVPLITMIIGNNASPFNTQHVSTPTTPIQYFRSFPFLWVCFFTNIILEFQPSNTFQTNPQEEPSLEACESLQDRRGCSQAHKVHLHLGQALQDKKQHGVKAVDKQSGSGNHQLEGTSLEGYLFATYV